MLVDLGSLGRSRAFLDASWTLLGRFLGASWSQVAFFNVFFGSCIVLGLILDGFWLDFWLFFGAFFNNV